jgi:hypothetical protein
MFKSVLRAGNAVGFGTGALAEKYGSWIGKLFGDKELASINVIRKNQELMRLAREDEQTIKYFRNNIGVSAGKHPSISAMRQKLTEDAMADPTKLRHKAEFDSHLNKLQRIHGEPLDSKKSLFRKGGLNEKIVGNDFATTHDALNKWDLKVGMRKANAKQAMLDTGTKPSQVKDLSKASKALGYGGLAATAAGVGGLGLGAGALYDWAAKER